MTSCTEFCGSLRSLQVDDGALPPRDELIETLGFKSNDKTESVRHLGTWAEIQTRAGCPVCQLVVAAIHDNTESPIHPDQPIGILLSPSGSSLRLSFPSPLGTRLAFISNNANHAHSPERARIVGVAPIQPSRILSWLEICDQHHAKCQIYPQEDKKQPALKLRVIDLVLGNVKHVQSDVRYVALSYVWGHLPMFQLRRDNLDSLSKEGSLEAIRKDLPKTVNDAIDLVRALGERYLWVDTLCLVQDDSRDVHDGIRSMDVVYRRSYFTIVAGSGADASHGLPGIAAESRRDHQIYREVAPGLSIAVQHSIDWHLGRSVYSTRGWTLQEIVLPQRTVIFINNQVYFRCREANWAEESWADQWTSWLDADDSNISRIPDYTDRRLNSLWAYQKLCEDFSKRKLRNDGDALRAVVGILRQLSARMNTGLVEGIPAYSIDMFLLFISSNGDLRRRPGFASFSWAGWEGKFLWPRENYGWYDGGKHTWKVENITKWLNRKCLVKWTFWEPCGKVHRIYRRRVQDPDPLVELMGEFPGLLPGDILCRLCSEDATGSGTSHHFGQEIWKMNESDSDSDSDSGSSRFFHESWFKFGKPRALDLTSSHAEADQQDEIRNRIGQWRASMNSYFAHSLQRSSPLKYDSIERRYYNDDDDDEWESSHYSFRRSGDMLAEKDQEKQRSDPRGERRREAQMGTTEPGGSMAAQLETPSFPPYSVLRFHTISLRLRIGNISKGPKPSETATDNLKYHMPPTPFDQISGYPLYGRNGRLVGSLHPDNIRLIEQQGSELEFLVLSRCQTPIVGSALLNNETYSANLTDDTQPRDLLWVIAVEWIRGIAERRGVGQIVTSALEVSLEPGPELKCVLLG